MALDSHRIPSRFGIGLIMVRSFDNSLDRFGSAGVASDEDILRSDAIARNKPGFFAGLIGSTILTYCGDAGAALFAAPRSGKFTMVLAWTLIDGQFRENAWTLDPKGEIASITRLQLRHMKRCFYWNPLGLHGLPQNKINPLSFMKKNSATLVSDVKVFCENSIKKTGSANGEYFEMRAREFLEGIVLAIIEREGCLTFSRLYEVINLLPSNSDRWLDFAFEMSEMDIELPQRAEAEIAEARGTEGNGFRGIMGEIFKAFSALSDPVLLKSVSPPFDTDFEDLVIGSDPTNVYLMPAAEFIDAWSSVIKSFFVGAMLIKGRHPGARRQTWFLDEAAQLSANGFPLLLRQYVIGAGLGIRPISIWQSEAQLKSVAPGAEIILPASCGLRMYFAVRDPVTAKSLSDACGSQTLEYDDHLARRAAAREHKEAVRRALIDGADPMEMGMLIRQHKLASQNRTKSRRMVFTPDEIMNLPNDRMLSFVDGVDQVMVSSRRPYFKEKRFNGLYHPSPFHPPLDRIRLPGFWGHKWRAVITERVPEKYAHLPQYADGTWSYIEGYRP